VSRSARSAPEPPIHIVWFRQDLRVADQAALRAAAGAVVPVYVLDDETPGEERMGAAQRWWLHHSLAALKHRLAELGAPLVLRRGPAADVLATLAAETGATSVHALRHYEPWWRRVEDELSVRVPLQLYRGAQLADPRAIRTGSGERYRVFTPWFERLQARMPPAPPSPAPERLRAPTTSPRSERLEDWNLRPAAPDWSTSFDVWTPGEAGARAAFDIFLPKIADYETERNFPSRPGVSRLSPHIHFGEISPATLWVEAEDFAGAAARSFHRELAWREYGLNLVDQFPDYAGRNGRPLFDRFPWRSGPEADADFRAWTLGLTGYPAVDAAMRELWRTGWMHNRLRMVAASFLVKHLLIDWRRGERWFWDTLLDADRGANAMNWQYVAGSGVDAPVFSRIMAPGLQSRKFEMAGYIRRHVPELANLGDEAIHAPHETPGAPPDYPRPIVSHAFARARALAGWRAARGEASGAATGDLFELF
jgi:deoxyribodipyrimidine photo-lyase